jgi:hypothetical protein
VYVVGSIGIIQHYDGSKWSLVYQDPSNLDLHGVWVDPAGNVYAAGDGQLVHCTPPCTQQSAFTSLSFSSQIMMAGVCGTTTGTAYAVGNDSNNNGYLYQWSAGAWNLITSNTGIVASTGCWADTSGNVFISGQSYVWRYANATFTQEQIPDYSSWQTSDIANQYWNGIWGDGTSVFAAGFRRNIIGRLPNGTWTFKNVGFLPWGVNDFHAIAGWTAADVYAAGTGDVSGEEAAEFTGGAWSYIPDLFPGGVYIWGMWAAGPNEFFAVGNDNSLNPYILHGTR